MRNPPSPSDDVIDSRNVIERIAELESEVEDDPEDEIAVNELTALRALADNASGSPDWQYGETLIRDSYFEEYARELAEEIGAINPQQSERWPYTCIDWETAAEELQQDYFEVDFGGETYWIRA